MLSEVQRRRRLRRSRRLFLMITLGLMVLSSVLLLRTLTMTSRQITVPPVPSIQIAAKFAAARLAQALPFRTISYQDRSQFSRDAFSGLHQYLVKTFPETHRALQRELINDYSVLYTWVGTEPALPPILLLGHLDVVPVEAGT